MIGQRSRSDYPNLILSMVNYYEKTGNKEAAKKN